MKVAIIGAGYVGLPTGAGLAKLGHDVICIDSNREKIEMLRAGRTTLYEEGLEELLREDISNGSLKFTDSIEEGIYGAQIVIVAVGTPELPHTGGVNMDFLFSAVEQTAVHMEKGTVIAIKSTVPVGTGDKVEALIQRENPSADVEVISLPEFLSEGHAVRDFFHPSRIVIGTQSEKARKLVRKLYEPMLPGPIFLCVSRRAAEVIKYASNSFLAMKIHYINEMSDFCEAVGVNIHEVAQGMRTDSRIGQAFLHPGPGFGGSCFPKDTKAMQHMAKEHGVTLSLIAATIKGNEIRREQVAQKIINELQGVSHPRVAVWGLAFKSGTDDCRESPAIGIIQHLIKRHDITVVAYDPKAEETAYSILHDNIDYAKDMYSAVEGAHALAILTEWPQFTSADWTIVKRTMSPPAAIIDCRFILPNSCLSSPTPLSEPN